mgnify:CR=1 FL=1
MGNFQIFQNIKIFQKFKNWENFTKNQKFLTTRQLEPENGQFARKSG